MGGRLLPFACSLVLSVTWLPTSAHPQEAPSIPEVHLSHRHAATCKVGVGDTFPVLRAPRLGGGAAELPQLYGDLATVVVFWSGDDPMSRMALGDLQRDVAEPRANQGVAVVGIAVKQSSDQAQASLQKSGAAFPVLVDAGGEAFAAVGIEKLPRVYLLDPQGKIVWFDIEYSLATRRELDAALSAIAPQR